MTKGIRRSNLRRGKRPMRLEKMVPGTEAWKNMLNAPMPKPKLTQKSKEVLSKPRNNVPGECAHRTQPL